MITAGICPLEDVKAVIYDDEIYERVTDDNCPPKEQFEIPPEGYIAIGGYIEGKIASIFLVHGNKMHFMVLKNYRKYARQLLDESFKCYPFKVYVEIPASHKPVINFAKNYGFKEIKIEKMAHKKNGQLYDVHTLEYGV